MRKSLRGCNAFQAVVVPDSGGEFCHVRAQRTRATPKLLSRPYTGWSGARFTATRRVALEMFPGKERAFDLLYRPKFQRVMHAVYRLQ